MIRLSIGFIRQNFNHLRVEKKIFNKTSFIRTKYRMFSVMNQVNHEDAATNKEDRQFNQVNHFDNHRQELRKLKVDAMKEELIHSTAKKYYLTASFYLKTMTLYYKTLIKEPWKFLSTDEQEYFSKFLMEQPEQVF